MPTKEQLLKRLRKKSKKGMRGWPVGTIAFYGPDASRATKVVVSIIPNEHAEPSEMRDWQIVPRRRAEQSGDRRGDGRLHGGQWSEIDRYDRWAAGMPASRRHRL
jgi:hypothetical protein